jgi:rhodanese-related sulfurtransferase
MHNDSIETLLLRHYGSTAQAPAALEQRLCASVRHKAAELHRQEKSIVYWRQERVSRRQAVKLVAMGATGVSALSIGMEALQTLGAALLGRDVTDPAYP